MNFFSKYFLLAFLTLGFLSSQEARALDVASLYTASCTADTGVIIGVDTQSITLVTIDGHIKILPRYEVIYVATYSLNSLPVDNLSFENAPEHLVIQTRQDEEFRELVSGWPVDFTENRIGFLTLTGGGVVIDRSNIWKIESTHLHESNVKTPLNKRAKEKIELIAPYPFSHCPPTVLNHQEQGKIQVTPQRLLGDALAIKEEFDRLMKGHEQIEFYKHRQVFYAVPFVYGHQSSLGLWTTAGSRHAQSQSRNNNFTPLLIDERGRGPFSFQQRSVTGVGPLTQGLHEEMQSQFSYAFQSSYVHFSAMLDPNLFLVGSRYEWTKADFSAASEDRISQTAQASLGVGYGAFALNFFLVNTGDVGISAPGFFDHAAVSVPSLGLSLEWPDLSTEILFGAGTKDSIDVSVLRANVKWRKAGKRQFLISYLNRHIQDTPSENIIGSFAFDGVTQTLAGYLNQRFGKRFDTGLFAAIESSKTSYGATQTSQFSSAIYPKAGFYGAIVF